MASNEVSLHKCFFEWTINNYHLVKLKGGTRIKSPQFAVGSDNKKYFNLELLYSVGKKEEDEVCIKLFSVSDFTRKPKNLLCNWTVSAINDKKEMKKRESNKNLFHVRWSRFIKIENIDQFISAKNTLTLHGEIEILEEIQSVLNSDIVCCKDKTVYTIKFDFSFLSEKLSDVKLIVGEQEIPAHKIILSTASPVFKATFTHDMLENNENSVKITDITEDILTEMLRYIYTGKIYAIKTDQIIELLVAADKYQIDSLKINCGKMLYTNLYTGNAIDILIAAHKYKVKNLEDEVIKFVTTHIQLFSYSEVMKKIDDPDIWVNLLQSVVKSQKNDSLKINCGKMLTDSLYSGNAIDILVTAHKYKVKNLEDEAIKFVTTHIQLFSYSEFMKKIDDPDIWVNLLQSVVKSQKNAS